MSLSKLCALGRARTALRVIAVITPLTYASGAHAQANPAYRFGGADVYGTDAITVEEFGRRFGDRARALHEAIQREQPAAIDSLLTSIGGELRSMADIVWTDLAMIFQPSDTTVYMTFDVVVRADSARRLVSSPAPAGQVPDPGGLIALWKEYEQQFMAAVMQARQLSQPTRENCPALHCLMTFGEDTALARYERAFVAQTPAHARELLRVLREDADEADRGAAAYLLAHAGVPDSAVVALVAAMQDPSDLVRNNATRVLVVALQLDPTLDVPIAPVIRNIDAPATTSRNKALHLLLGLAQRSENHERIAREAGPTLLRLLHLVQPNNHEPAWGILKTISGESYGARDYATWERWLAGRTSR